jgi:ribosomal protein L37AE/L43A
MTVEDGEWRELTDFLCRICGKPAYMSPYTNSIWGCKHCGYTTRSVFTFFKPADEEKFYKKYL